MMIPISGKSKAQREKTQVIGRHNEIKQPKEDVGNKRGMLGIDRMRGQFR